MLRVKKTVLDAMTSELTRMDIPLLGGDSVSGVYLSHDDRGVRIRDLQGISRDIPFREMSDPGKYVGGYS